MKKLASTLPNMLLSLGLVCIIAAAILGGMFLLTKKPIAKADQEGRISAIKKVAPAFDNNPVKEAVEVHLPDGRICTVYPAYIGGKLNGAAVAVSTMDGFAGEISIMAGFTADGKVNDYQVLSHAETPGLGSKMQMWFRDPKGARSVIDKSPADTKFFVSKDKDAGGEIDAITAATISSRAFLGALRTAYDLYREFKEAHE